MAGFLAGHPDGLKVKDLEPMLRSAIFKSANALVAFLLQQAADLADAAYQPKPGQVFQGRVTLWINGMFGNFQIERDYYYHPGNKGGCYFNNNIERMQYGTFRAKGFFIGSGVMEAGCKTVIGARCKQSGMFWGRAGAQNIVALRCVDASRRLDEFWKDRLNAHAARNDTLPLAA
jgi:hypothetical protein